MDKLIHEEIQSYYNIYSKIGEVYERLAKLHNLTSTSLFVLYVIHQYPDKCTQRFISKQLSLPKQTVNTVLNFFEKSGYITKKVMSTDKRNKTISLTKKGAQYADLILKDLFYLEEKAFKSMSPESRAGMIQGEQIYLEKITEVIEYLDNKKL